MDEMNDVNDFMEKFGDDFELKWGLAIDPELGKPVKVTVLATGFGLEDVEGMNRHIKKHTEEEARRIAEEEEKRAERRRPQQALLWLRWQLQPSISVIHTSSCSVLKTWTTRMSSCR